jgi:hypothetical protein
MVRWLRNRIHRIYVYFAVGLLGMFQTMTHTDAQSDLYLYLVSAISIASVCLIRTVYEAGKSIGRAEAKRELHREAVHEAAEFICRLRDAGDDQQLGATHPRLPVRV